jgi:uncharacterized oligopeptide transporter (OPT) family protein
MASVAKGIFGGSLPWGMIGIGVLLGIATSSSTNSLKARGSNFRTPVLAVAIGITCRSI